ncbi:MAG: hypothetical protein AB8B81_18970, partial [Halioglobus sp.]
MKATIFLPGLMSLSLAACVLTANPTDPVVDRELKVLLQGSSAYAMAELITNNGGTVTHHLPIIDAVGANISRENLDEVIKSPLVDRYLDDLSVSDAPDNDTAPEEKTCDVGGALELDIGRGSIKWRLYNIEPEVAKLQHLELSWPDSMGRILELTLGTASLASAEILTAAQDNHLELDYGEEAHPELQGMLELHAVFEAHSDRDTAPAPLQRDFAIEATFTEDCSTKLVPGYTNNHENTYYPSIVGAAALHRHGITGSGVTVAIIDSGLWEHTNLLKDTHGKNRVIARYDAIKNISDQEVFDES